MDTGWWAQRARWGEPGRRDETVLRRIRRVLGPIIRLSHRPRMEGAQHVPRDAPFLLVANHSGGMAIAELGCLIVLSGEYFDDVRIAGLAHPISFHVWPLTKLMRWVGAIPSSYEAAEAALESGAGVLVFPGGDHEASRPFWQAKRVDFNGRKGFLRIARDAGVPIVPMGISGSHLSVPILHRSRLLPKLLLGPWLFGVKRVPLTLLGVLGTAAILGLGHETLGWPLAAGLTWLWLASPLPLWPIVPTSIRFRIGEPIAPEVLFPPGDDLESAYAQVHDRIQALVLGEG